MREYILRDRVYYSLVLILVGLTMFVLGRLSKVLDERPEFTIEDAKVEANNVGGRNVGTSTIVATKSGTKYYFLWCKGANSLREENKIYFQSEEQAKKAGYTLANNCK